MCQLSFQRKYKKRKEKETEKIKIKSIKSDSIREKKKFWKEEGKEEGEEDKREKNHIVSR